MSKCNITWDVPVETGHHFFFTQEAFNRYNKTETFEQKILNRYSSFPLQESNIGANAQSKRSQRKQENKQDGKKEKFVRQFHSLSDESDNEVNFDPEPIELEEIGVTSKVILEKSHKETKDVEFRKLKGDIIEKKSIAKNAEQACTYTENVKATDQQPSICSEKDIGDFGLEKNVPIERTEVDDLEEFGIHKSSVQILKKKDGVQKQGNDESEAVGLKEKKKSTVEEFPWDTKYRERRSEKFDLNKYHNRKSSLTSREQKQYLNLHTKYAFSTPKNPTDREKHHMKEFSVLHWKVTEEQKEFQQYLERLAQTLRAEYNYLAPEADRYFKERLALKKKKIHLYPQYYNLCDKLNLSAIGPPCQLLFVMSLLEMGTVPKLMIPNMDVGDRPRIPIDYESITKKCPCVHSKSTNIWNHEPCSQDQNCDILSQRYKVHITISASALACLVNNHAPNYGREWEIPFTVRDYQLQEGDKKFMHRVVYIDNPLPVKELTGRDKNTMFYKYALRSHMGRFNQNGHTFTANQKSDPDLHHQEASKLSRQKPSAEHFSTPISKVQSAESDIPLLSPIKSPNKKEMKKRKLRKESKVKDEYDDVDTDPFGTMEVSMEDLETFGTDLSKNIKIKKVVEKVCITPEKNVTGSDSSDVIRPAVTGSDSSDVIRPAVTGSDSSDVIRPAVNTPNQRLNASVDSVDKNMSVAREVLEKNMQDENTNTNKNVLQSISQLQDFEKVDKVDIVQENEGKGTKSEKNEQEMSVEETVTELDKVESSKGNVTESINRFVEQEGNKEMTEIAIESVQQNKQSELSTSVSTTQYIDVATVSNLDQYDKDKNISPDKNLSEVQMSSASDDESDALVIDEPVAMDTDMSDNGKKTKYSLVQNFSQDGLHQKSKYSFSNIETPRSPPFEGETPRSPPLEGDAMDMLHCPVIMATPDSPVPDTPSSPTRTGSSFTCTLSSPTSPSKKMRRSSSDIFKSSEVEIERVLSPGRTDKRFISPGECKIIPLQRDSEEENVIDNSCVYMYQKNRVSSPPKIPKAIGLTPKSRKSTTKSVSDSDENDSNKMCIDIKIEDVDTAAFKDNHVKQKTDATSKIFGVVGQSDVNNSNFDDIDNNIKLERNIDNSDSVHENTLINENKEKDERSDPHLSKNLAESNKMCIDDSPTLEVTFTNESIIVQSKHLVNSDSVCTDDLNKQDTGVPLTKDEMKSKKHFADSDEKSTEAPSMNNSNNSNKGSINIPSKDSGESSDEVVSFTKLRKQKKSNKDRSNSVFLSTRRRARIIESDSDSDEQATVNMAVDLDKNKGEIEPIVSVSYTKQTSKSVPGKRTRSISSSSEADDNKKSIVPSQSKQPKSGKDCRSQLLLDMQAESIEEMACVRRKTRSSVGTKMKDKLSENIEISDKTESQESKTKSSEDNVLSDVSIETVSMVTRRQTRKSMDDTSDNKSQDPRSSKLAILDRVKKSLRATSEDGNLTAKQTDGKSTQPKRKRGRPPKVKAIQVSVESPVIKCKESNTTSDNTSSDRISPENVCEKLTLEKTAIEEEFSSKQTVAKSSVTDSQIDLKSTNLDEYPKITQDSTVSKHSVENVTSISAEVGGNEKVDENLTEIGKSDISSKASVAQNLHRSINCSAVEIENKTDSRKYGKGHSIGHERDGNNLGIGEEKEQSKSVFEKTNPHKIDPVKKPRPQKAQPSKASINPLENIMQAQEKLLDNPKHHKDQAQQQYLSQFKFPERHNITYHLWSLGAYSVMIRCGYHGVYKDPSQKVSFVHVSPKMEYQVNHGLEQLTTNEISKEWASAYVRPNCKIIRARINPLQSEIVSMKEEELNTMQPTAHGFNPANGFQMLANVFHRLHQCSPGQYLLHHVPGSTECQIKQATENNKTGTYDLQMSYLGFMGDKKDSSHVPWIPIDPNYIQNRFHYKGRIPVTFEPKDYKHGGHNKTKKKKKKSLKK